MEIKRIESGKKDFLDLLLLADEQENMIDKYLERGDLFALYDGGLKSVCVVTRESDDVCELKNIATYENRHGKGYGSKLLNYIFSYYKDKYKTMLVGTGDSPRILRFYRRNGFEISHRIENFFTDNYGHPMFDDGVQLVDMVYLSKTLYREESKLRKILLTSSGFETENIIKIFLGLFEKEPADINALFVPTAANSPSGDGIEVLPKCMNDLLKAGILSKNISVFDLHRNMEFEELKKFDAIYFTGGSPQYLLDRINDTGFNKSLEQYVDNGGVFVGVSAGSIIAANNMPNNLGYINCKLGVHTQAGTKSGVINISENPQIDLTGSNVVLILGNKCEVME